MIHELHELLVRAGARVRSLRLWTSLALCWLFWATIVYFAARVAEPGWHWPTIWATLLGSAAVSALACWIAASRTGRNPHRIAQRIEAAHPELGAMLLAALEQAPSPRFKRLGYLQASVVRGAVSHGRRHNWADATSRGRVRLAKAAHLASLAALASACLFLADRTKAHGRSDASDNDRESLFGDAYDVTVLPGDAEIERGTTLVVLARFLGPLPPDVDLIVEQTPRAEAESAASIESAAAQSTEPDAAAPLDGDDEARTVRAMTRSLDDPQFVGRVAAVTRELTYHVEFAGQHSPTYRITVFEYPELVRADAQLDYPQYTGLEAKVVEDVRQVTAVEGTQLTLKFRLNKDVADARLVDRDGEEVVLVRAEGADPIYQISYKLERSQRFKLHLRDRQDRRNKLPPDFAINVTPNNPPTIKLAKPGRDVRVSPIEELQLAAELSDDYGLTGYGLSYSLGGDEPQDLVIPPPAESGDKAAPKKISVSQLLDFEALESEPDQLVSYHMWVEDVGPDGQPRRTLSDMYFAEVRHFDEIFREGEQPTDQQMQEQQQQAGQPPGGAGQQAEELAELQKQIVGATWKLIRRETGEQPTAEFAADAGAVRDGQQQALEQLAALGEQLTDAESLAYHEQVAEHMNTVLERLTLAIDSADLTALRPALSAEQAAYQALLKLRAREFNVTRGNPGQGQSGANSSGGSASQQQLQQLELSNSDNRYETQSRAQSAQRENAEQLEESRQILNRLRELARRQQDLNERLRELQASLQQAETPEERAEIERQLKRLRDQQREILRDTESLENDVQTSENRDQMQQASEQLEQTRSRVQEASQALEQGQVSQALTEGARAERELDQLRDDFRRQTADRFSEEMRNLRDAAQRLDERQERLSEQLDELNNGARRSLREEGPREELVQGLQEQQRELNETLDQMRETVAEAEEPEPLLAHQLYDAVQQTDELRTAEALDVARQLTEAGVASEATEAMRQAGQGVRQLRERIDAAAESVLGDETEALRRANDQLRQLAEALNQEIAEAQGEPRPESDGQQDAQSQRGRRGENGQNGEREQNNADSQRGEGEGDAPQESEDGEQQGEGQPPGEEGESQEPAEGQGRGRGQGAGGDPQENQENPEDPQRQSPGDSSEIDQQSEQQSDQASEQGQGEREGQQQGEGQGGGRGGGDRETPDDQANGEPSADQDSPNDGSPNDGAPNDANRNGGQRRGNPNGRGGVRGGDDRIGNLEDIFGGGGPEQLRGPITGEDFRPWSEGMREVEDMLDDPELSAEVARIRDRAEAARVEFKRHATKPDWNKLVEMVAEPLNELRSEIAEEIRRKEAPDALAPIDRDAAPADFAEEVRQYYLGLGRGQ